MKIIFGAATPCVLLWEHQCKLIVHLCNLVMPVVCLQQHEITGQPQHCEEGMTQEAEVSVQYPWYFKETHL